MAANLPPRDRLLAAARCLLHRKEPSAISVQQLVDAARVTRWTLYRHFAGKDELIAASVAAGHADIAAEVGAIGRSRDDPQQRLGAFIAAIVTDGQATGTPYRAWFVDAASALCTAAGHDDPAYAARALLMLGDGAAAARRLGDDAALREHHLRAARAVAAVAAA
jgi:AcrR family transcriptional regulator